jgi:hypothetical protein
VAPSRGGLCFLPLGSRTLDTLGAGASGTAGAAAWGTGFGIGWQVPSTRENPSAQRCSSCARRLVTASIVFLVVSWVVVSDNSLKA